MGTGQSVAKSSQSSVQSLPNGHGDEVESLPLENRSSINAPNYSALDSLEAYRQPTDGKLELLLCWPDSDIAPQHWRQKSNPYLKSGAVTGYEAISCPHSAHAWGGLQSGHANAVLNGSTNNDWYYAIGSYAPWNRGIPGPSKAVQKVELYARSSTHKNWRLIMRQTAPAYWSRTGLWRLTQTTIDSNNYSALDSLEAYRQPADGKLELLLCWPATELAPQHWRQKSNPYLKSGAVTGYEAISCPHSAHAWGGLQSGHANAVLNGSTNNYWYYAIGSYADWNGGIPGPRQAVHRVELWARHPHIPSHTSSDCFSHPPSGNWDLIMRQSSPRHSSLWWQYGSWSAPVDVMRRSKLEKWRMNEVARRSFVVVLLCVARLRRTTQSNRVLRLVVVSLSSGVMRLWLRPLLCLRRRRFRYCCIPPCEENINRLECLEECRYRGKLELQLRWPDSDIAPQHWRQKSNPYLKSGAVTGYEAISCPHSAHAWGGLQSGHPSAVLNGSTNNYWYYAIGSYADWNGGIPGPSKAVQRVELWARRPPPEGHDNNKTGRRAWTLIMRQVRGAYWPADCKSLTAWRTVNSPNYSVLHQLESYRQPVDGKLELQLRWPDSDLAPQHWRQKSNPYLKSGAVTGYEAISCPHSAHAWGGLQSGHAHAVLKGSTNNLWYYAIGSCVPWNGGIPGPSKAVQRVELWTRRSKEDQWTLIMRQTAPRPYWTKQKSK